MQAACESLIAGPISAINKARRDARLRGIFAISVAPLCAPPINYRQCSRHFHDGAAMESVMARARRDDCRAIKMREHVTACSIDAPARNAITPWRPGANLLPTLFKMFITRRFIAMRRAALFKRYCNAAERLLVCGLGRHDSALVMADEPRRIR